MPSPVIALPMLALLIAVPCLMHGGEPSYPSASASDASAEDKEPTVTVVIRGEPYTGRLLPPATERSFRILMLETGDALTFRWSSLEPAERKRVRKLCGLEAETSKRWGKEVQCVRLKLKTGKTTEGLEVPERSRPGHRCIRTATAFVQIPKKEIKSEEKLVKWETDVYGPEEIYERLALESPPDMNSAKEQLRFARICTEIGLFDRAIDHLEMARVIDSRTAKSHRAFRVALLRRQAEAKASLLYLKVLRDMRGGDHASALDKIRRLKRNYPGTSYYRRVEELEGEAEAGAEADFGKMVVLMYHTFFNDLVDERLARKVRLDERGRPVVARPGKQVAVLTGHVLRGELVNDTEKKLVLRFGDSEFEVPRETILSVEDVDLSRAAGKRDPTFAELKAWANDVQNGIGKDIVDRICLALKADRHRVLEAWRDRFRSVTRIDEAGQYIRIAGRATRHRAFYGKGSWLREGVVQVPISTLVPGYEPQKASGYARTRRPRWVDPELSNDPEVWWKAQRWRTKVNILLAIASEKLFRVIKPLTGKPCQECGCKGYRTVVDLRKNEIRYVRCPCCRGLKLLTVIQYE